MASCFVRLPVNTRIAFFDSLTDTAPELSAVMTTMPQPEMKPNKNLVNRWICAALILAIAAAYWPVASYPFTAFDDPQYVFKNPEVCRGVTWPGLVWAFTHFHAGNWHPLTWLSHMLDVQLFGLHAGAHHVVNVVFHAANTVLLFLWLERVTGFRWRSAMVAGLFALHPLHVESVAWVAERKDVLSTFFFFLTLLAYTRYVQLRIQNPAPGYQSPTPSSQLPSSIFYLLALVCFALGLMSKPMLVTLPFVLLLLDYWPLKRMQNAEFRMQNWLSLALEKIPFLLLSVLVCWVTMLAQRKAEMPAEILPLVPRMGNALIAYLGYLEKMAWPEGLAALYPLCSPIDTDQAILGGFVLLLISALVFTFRRQGPWLLTGWLWYLGILVPVIGLIQVGSQSMADRYSYVPSVGIFIIIVWLVAEISQTWRQRRLVLSVLSVGMLAVCWKLTANQVRYWQDTETLARHALAVTTRNSSMQILLGNALFNQGKVEAARQCYAKAVEIAPDSIPAKGDLAFTLVTQGKLDEAAEICRAVLAQHPEEARLHYILGNILSTRGRQAEAIEEYKAALQYDSDQILALNDLAWLLATAPDPHYRNGPEAVRLAEHACELSNYKTTLYVGTLAAAYAEAGRFDDAVQTAQKAIATAAAEKNNRLVQENRELLALYQQNKAYHEPTPAPKQ
jgi:cytochrome c-type biogenesis protein CcmH/NrfG